MSQSTMISIIEKYGKGPISPEEEALLVNWLAHVSPEEFHATLELCAEVPEWIRGKQVMSAGFSERLSARLDEADGAKLRKMSWRRWAVAAAVILAVAGAYLVIQHKNEPLVQRDVAPGGDGAVLTLADGKQIVLDSVGNGQLAVDGDATILKTGSGQVTYQGKKESAALTYNTLTTPRGKKTSLILADGTRVWLNAASSIRFPTIFSGKDRTVEITGEAYFEVAKQAGKPFFVKKGDYHVEVLGTGFNINAYDDEDAIRTTLVEGSVRVVRGSAGLVLKPGEQAAAFHGKEAGDASTGGMSLDRAVNTEHVLAWKNGNFSFERSEIGEVMREIGRWYDIDVAYEGKVSAHFGGSISRNVNLSQVFKMLEMTGTVRFVIEGRKVTVIAASH